MVTPAPGRVPPPGERPAPRRLRRFAAALETAWSILGIALVLLLGLDAAVNAYLVRRDQDFFRAYMNAYPDPDHAWVPAYTEEFLQHDKALWRPYVYWRRAPFLGQYFGVDERGLRHTWNAPHRAAERPLRVFTFGGSTMWGTGVRPDYTLASWLARDLEQAGIAVEVTNFGEGGYVTTQELLTLLLELRRGNVPDLVVFYDGVNEAATAYQNGKAGFTSNESHRAEEFNVDERRSRLEKLLALVPGLRRFTAGLGKRLAKSYAIPPEKAGTLTDDTIRVYRENVRVVELLGREYGFASLFYWQPVIFSKDHLAPNEVKAEADFRYIREFNLDVYERIKADAWLAARPTFHNVSDIFRTTETGVFADFCHLSEHGNEVVARRMAQDAEPLLRQRRQALDSTTAAK